MSKGIPDVDLEDILEAAMMPDEEIIFLNREIVRQNGRIIDMNFKMLEWLNAPPSSWIDLNG